MELPSVVGGERRAAGREVGEEGEEVEEVVGLGDGRVEPRERVVLPRRATARRRCRRLRRRRNLHFIRVKAPSQYRNGSRPPFEVKPDKNCGPY